MKKALIIFLILLYAVPASAVLMISRLDPRMDPEDSPEFVDITLTGGNIFSASSIKLKPSGEPDDYLAHSVPANIPTTTIIGGIAWEITSDDPGTGAVLRVKGSTGNIGFAWNEISDFGAVASSSALFLVSGTGDDITIQPGAGGETNITSDLDITPDGAKIKLSNNSQTLSISASASMSSSDDYTLPPTDAASDGLPMMSNSSGALRFDIVDISEATNLAVDTDHFALNDDTIEMSVNQDTNLHVWQGSFLEQFDFTITEAAGTVTGNLEKEGTGDLTMYFSDEFTELDCTAPLCTVDLTALVGTDAVPAEAFVYITQSTKTLTAAGSWPAAAVEHIRVASIVLRSAATTGTDGALQNRNWNDFAFGITNPRGHGLHIAERLRAEHAKWLSGVDLTVTGDGTGTITLDTSSGMIYQLHLQAFPALDMAGADDIHIVNQVVDEGGNYETSTNLVDDVTHFVDGTDSGTAFVVNRYFNVVIWGVQNRTGETSHLMLNLPTGQYTGQSSATADVSNFSVRSIPSAFTGTGFLIGELTFRLTGGGNTWTLVQEKSLLGITPGTAAGGGVTTTATVFSDASFAIFDNLDDSKRVLFQASSIATGNDRTITMADVNVDLADVALNNTHRADNSQAHSDYLKNDEDDTTTGVLTVKGLGTGGQTDYDLKVGDTDGTPTYGMIQMGNSCIGRTSFAAGNIDLDGSMIYRNIAGPVTSEIEHVFVESTGDSTRFALAKAGVGNATYNSRSMLIAGPAPADTDYVKVSYWQGQGIFDNLVCDTSGTGADLGVQNDLEVEGDIFTDSIKESTTDAGISFNDFDIKNVGELDGTVLTGSTKLMSDLWEAINSGDVTAEWTGEQLGFVDFLDTVADEHIDMGTPAGNPFNGGGAMSISIWVNPDDGALAQIGAAFDFAGATDGWQLLQTATGNIRMLVSDGTLTNQAISTNIGTGSWVHLVGTFDGADEVVLYVNHNDQKITNSDNTLGSIANSEEFLVGLDMPGNRPFNGQGSDVMFFSAVITDVDVEEIFDLGVASGSGHNPQAYTHPDLVSWWKLTQNYNDAQPAAHNATNNGTVLTVTNRRSLTLSHTLMLNMPTENTEFIDATIAADVDDVSSDGYIEIEVDGVTRYIKLFSALD